jgi:hypothetical protein
VAEFANKQLSPGFSTTVVDFVANIDYLVIVPCLFLKRISHNPELEPPEKQQLEYRAPCHVFN